MPTVTRPHLRTWHHLESRRPRRMLEHGARARPARRATRWRAPVARVRATRAQQRRVTPGFRRLTQDSHTRCHRAQQHTVGLPESLSEPPEAAMPRLWVGTSPPCRRPRVSEATARQGV
eukprot:6504356-Prymnesium_polylepis.1